MILKRGTLKSLSYLPDREDKQQEVAPKPFGRKKLAVAGKEDAPVKTGSCIRVTCGAETHYAAQAEIRGPSKVLQLPLRIETYAEVALQLHTEPFGIFVISHNKTRLVVVAKNENVARGMHPKDGVTWNEKKEAWFDTSGQEDLTWPNPRTLLVQRIGEEKFQSDNSRLYTWEETT